MIIWRNNKSLLICMQTKPSPSQSMTPTILLSSILWVYGVLSYWSELEVFARRYWCVRWRIQFVVRTSLQDFRNQDGKRSLDGRVSFPDFNQSISFAVSFATEGQREELRRRRDSLKFKRDYNNILFSLKENYLKRLFQNKFITNQTS